MKKLKDLTWQEKKLLFQQMFFAFWIKEKEDPHGFHLQINHDRKKTSKKLLPFIQCTSMIFSKISRSFKKSLIMDTLFES